MKKVLSLMLVLGLCIGLVGCSNGDESKDTSQDDTKTNETVEKESKTINDFSNAKAEADKIVKELNSKIDDGYSYSNFSYDENWLHITYKNTGMVTFEVDFKADETFVGITIDNNSTDTINDGFRSLPAAAISLSAFNINDEDKNNIIDLMTNLDKDDYSGSNVDVMDNKMLNIFSITKK